MHLDEHPPTRRGCFVGQAKKRLPHIGRLAAAEHTKRDRHAGINGKRFEPTEIFINPFRIEPGVFVGNFKHTGVQLTHDAHQLAYLLPGCQPAGNRLTVRRLMVVGT